MTKRWSNMWLASVVSMVVAMFLIGIVGACQAAHAQSLPTTQPVNPLDPVSVLVTLVTAVQHHAWSVVVSAVLVLVVLGLRQLGGMFWPALKGDRWGAILALSSGALGSILLALCAGKPITPELIVGGIVAGVTAAGGWNVTKRLIWPVREVTLPKE